MCVGGATPVQAATAAVGIAAAPATGGGSLITLGNVLTAASAISTVVQTIGVIRQSRAASGQATFKAGIANNNAIIAENNAQAVLQTAEADAQDKRRETRQRIGLQRAQLAAAGFSVSEGSSIDILSDTAALGELDVLRIESDAQNKADNFRKAGNINAASSLISGASKTGTTFLATRP